MNIEYYSPAVAMCPQPCRIEADIGTSRSRLVVNHNV